MLKLSLICLLILNTVVFAMWYGYLANPFMTARQPQRLLNQKNSEYLKLIPADEAAAQAQVVKVDEPAEDSAKSRQESRRKRKKVRDTAI